ncbi:MAG: hypothetical protein QOJ16_4918 [Acidobacteriota bacterium]|jgi:hypothetical protein|nr:hypothetical protein [Acidobacteriota bacterium]
MISRTSLRATFALTLLALALVAHPVQAEAARQCQAQAVCSAPAATLETADFLLPARSTAATTPPAFALNYIGQCCTNNDASLCPAVAGYSTVRCSFPMCGSGLLTCVYSQ